MNLRETIKAALQVSPYGLRERWRQARLEARARRIIAQYVAGSTTRKLHIGCGGSVLADWLNSDLVPYSDDIAFLDAGRPFPVRSATFDYIYSEHVFEHLTFCQQKNYLNEAFRVLKPRGKIRIATPDFTFLMRLAQPSLTATERRYLHWNFETFVRRHGATTCDPRDLAVYVINNYFKDWGHQLIHSFTSLAKLVGDCGFDEVKLVEIGQSDEPTLRGLERHAAMITEEYNQLETMVLEAAKPE